MMMEIELAVPAEKSPGVKPTSRKKSTGEDEGGDPGDQPPASHHEI